jgi:hydroxypyruvate reductase
MERDLRKDAFSIIDTCIKEMQPADAVSRALKGQSFTGRLFLLAAGKAAWQMAGAAYGVLGERIERGTVITKYGHSRGDIGCKGNIEVFEAGHPVPDENSYRATQAALDMVSELNEGDTLLLLLSGGGSALFENPLISAAEVEDITGQLLSCGADISEINTIRKRLSAVKGGRLAEACHGSIYQVILSDVIGDRLDMIASGPAAADSSTCEDALAIATKYGLRLSDEAKACLRKETPKNLRNVESKIVGSVRLLCESAARAAERLGYKAEIVTDSLDCEARDAGKMLAEYVAERAACYAAGHPELSIDGHAESTVPRAFIFGGETVVHLKGSGKGGRNQELALSAADGIEGLDDVLIFSFGSDGTDGPTDAAGGIVDGQTASKLREKGVSIEKALADNDSYNVLKDVDGLIVTGPTGTNVNDISVILMF